mmetsp:Transcript_63049/g.117264  ORF Transcript_63049/g.117264 Transcript_63049/m.117264 type:complete len:380 (-) Transcript_63049:104-1243(-)
MSFAKSMPMCFIALLTCVSVASGLRPHDVYAEEAAAAGHLMPHANHSMLEANRESTRDYFPPQGDCPQCKIVAAFLASLAGRIYSADFWQQKMADALILKTVLAPDTLLPVDPPTDEHIDVVKMAEAMIEVATATGLVKTKLLEIAALPGTDNGDTLNTADGILQEIMAILAPLQEPNYDTKAGTFLAAFGKLGDFMRNALLQLKPNADHYNEKFQYVQQSRIISEQVRTISDEDTDDEPDLVPATSAQSIQDWVTGIVAMVNEVHEFYYREPVEDQYHKTAMGPWTKLIGRCSRLTLDPTWKSTMPLSAKYISNHLDRGLYPFMQIIDRKSSDTSLMHAILFHWNSRTVVKETEQTGTESEPLAPKKVKTITYPAISW